MTKAQLIKELSKKTSIERSVTEATLEAFMKSIEAHVIDKKMVCLRGFGTFRLKKRAAKVARNISKNEKLYLPACFVPVFKPSKQFSGRLRKLKTA
ncbi:MAG TPA: HU family DNA-binding protein [Bacteroidia bacterium]|jgi:DNA-binding protein HU-beta|nr:HU family DNA-binding protein [Bacteroidia bacterium]